MFSSGRLLFALIFVIAFVILMIWSYRKDRGVNRLHFKQPYKILLAILGAFLLLFLIVKLRHLM